MACRAKFKLTHYETHLYTVAYEKKPDGSPDYSRAIAGEVRTMNFSLVSDGSEENKRFFASTPQGNIKLGVLNEAAWSQFELNKDYYVDFTKAD